jgi:hypothetical protein
MPRSISILGPAFKRGPNEPISASAPATPEAWAPP